MRFRSSSPLRRRLTTVAAGAAVLSSAAVFTTTQGAGSAAVAADYSATALCPRPSTALSDDYLRSLGITDANVPNDWNDSLEIVSIVCHVDNAGVQALELRVKAPGSTETEFGVIVLGRNDGMSTSAIQNHIRKLAEGMSLRGVNSFDPTPVSLSPNVVAAFPRSLSSAKRSVDTGTRAQLSSMRRKP